MIKEQLITFETAQLSKDKGFTNGSQTQYTKFNTTYEFDGDPTHQESYKKGEIRIHKQFWFKNDFELDTEYYEEYEAPTQSLLRTWLRNEHKINIVIWFNSLTEKYRIDAIITPNDEIKFNDDEYSTYEDALEVALQISLKSIKTKN